MNKIVLITGASSGIGYETAKQLIENDFKVIACGRNKDRLAALEQDISNENLKTLSFDIRSKVEVNNAISSLPQDWKCISILINNAGNAFGLEDTMEANIEDWENTLSTNVLGLTYITKTVLPLLKDQESAQIINIGSIAGREYYPNGNMYCSSKAAVDMLSKSMRLDLLKYGIRVSHIAPGLVETSFSEVRFKGDKERADAVYQGYQPLLPKDIADTICWILNTPSHVNLADILILPADQASARDVKKI